MALRRSTKNPSVRNLDEDDFKDPDFKARPKGIHTDDDSPDELVLRAELLRAEEEFFFLVLMGMLAEILLDDLYRAQAVDALLAFLQGLETSLLKDLLFGGG